MFYEHSFADTMNGPALKKFEEVNAPVKPLSGERWTTLNIPSKRPYLISTKGRIYSSWSGRIIIGKVTSGVLVFEYTPQLKKKEKTKFTLPVHARTGKVRKPYRNGKIAITIQQLVAQTFLKRPKGNCIVVHLSFDILDNSVKNLKWVQSHS